MIFNGVTSSCFPSSTGLGASFDVDLAYKVGQALADECRAKGEYKFRFASIHADRSHILLAPTVNTQRSPLGGRSFESFSEDPNLNGLIAAAYINGVQSKGVSATIKHYVANDQEFERFSISSDVSERALREIYLKPFQLALKHADPWALMSSYNRVNGLHVSEDKRLLDDILRKEWGFKGMIMSDWIGVYSTAESIKAGLDLEMPGPTVMRGRAVDRALIAQKLFPSDIDARVRKILELLQKALASGIPFDAPEEGVDTPELRQLLRTAAADSVVLLKNDKNVLPLKLDESVKKIAVIGPNAKFAMTSGGGSARLLESWTVSPLEGIKEWVKGAGNSAEVNYTIGVTSHKYLPLLSSLTFQEDGTPGSVLEFWNEKPAKDFMDLNPDMSANIASPAWGCTTKVTNIMLLDGVDASKVDPSCYIRYTTTFIPDESGDWELGLSVSGTGNFFIDDKLLVDLSTDPPPGNIYVGMGTAEVSNIAKGLKAGQKYRVEIRVSNIEMVKKGLPFAFWGGLRFGGIKVVEKEEAFHEAVDLAKGSDGVPDKLLFSSWESEGFDRDDLELPGLTNRLVSEILQANPKTIVVNQSGSAVTMPWIDEASTVLQAFYGGNELGNGLADVISGKVNPSAKLSLTFPGFVRQPTATDSMKRLEDVPSYPSYGGKGQEPGKILYNEGIFVGYRGYQIKNLAPMFPFGHGLSYSKFDYSGLKCTPISSEGNFTISFTITNSSQVDGREVAQVYVHQPQASLPRPVREMKGFIKVTLKAGEGKEVKVDLDREALGYYDERRMCWVAEMGKFEVSVGASSEDIKLKGTTELGESLTWTGL
ncbi:hypothetical protein D9758_004863 [Tetrapyrgos nigripes]|uniref:beta-glucosidase n=1 Tax=Tetrapyrgos nigripes TaxID=182062 RepID=A0A8H5G5V5_9AGAR|nr:hypothetical protein D9758_004863 [Tetrapyrgos nigripes]